MKHKLNLILFLLVGMISMSSCKKSAKNWNKITNSVKEWNTYNLQINGVKAAFPQKPSSKTTAYNESIDLHENHTKSDTVTYSVTLITNKSLKDAADWNSFLKKEVLAFKALEQKNIKVQGRDAILSKVRENDLCSYSINMIVDNRFIANISIRYKGDFPTEKLIRAFASRVRF